MKIERPGAAQRIFRSLSNLAAISLLAWIASDMIPGGGNRTMSIKRDGDRLDPVQLHQRSRRNRCLLVLGLAVFWLGTWIFWTYVAENPRDYSDIYEHFKYGSIGSDRATGIPYLIWRVLPKMFPNYLPEPQRFLDLPPRDRTALAGYQQFGFLVEPGRDLPIGFSKRRVNIDRVGLNCAICHVGTIKVDRRMDSTSIYGGDPPYLNSGHKDRVLILGMPANTVDLARYAQFLQACAKDDRFNANEILNAIRELGWLNPADAYILRAAVPKVRDILVDQAEAFQFLEKNPPSGPGRIDTFNPYKYKFFKFPQDTSLGTSDFPSIWNQRPREGMYLHWDGNNDSVFERNLSAAMGAGATPATVDIPRMMRVAKWLGAPDPKVGSRPDEIAAARAQPFPREGELPIPKFPYPIDAVKAQHGAAIYRTYCASCHDWQGAAIGQVVPLKDIQTDPERLASFTTEFAFNQDTFGSGHWWRFRRFRKTHGYVNMPLDGIWAQAPYLHNGSVPTLRDLLNDPPKRPAEFTRGDDVYDPDKVGFRSIEGRAYSDDGLFRLQTIKTNERGNAHGGHYGLKYGTKLPDDDKDALLEFLKTL